MRLQRAHVAASHRALGAGCCLAVTAAFAGAQGSVGYAPVAARLSPVGIVRAAPDGLRPFFQTTSTSRGRPPIEPARVVGEALAGAYAGLAGYFVGSWLGGLTGEWLDAASEGTKEQIRFSMEVVGAGLATATAVTVVGNIGDQTGSYPAALAGTAGGVVAGIILNQLLYGHARLPTEGKWARMRWIEASLEAMLPSIGATLAFTSSRRYK